MQKGNIGIFRYFSTRSVILCGIETHACIHHTALDLIERGIEVSINVLHFKKFMKKLLNWIRLMLAFHTGSHSC